ncbi:Sensor histidine kinase RcsC [Achromobacter insolitus]|uniref:hybrid sensor histidine kinase/response regulator n=1 Tax=Achromobacter insolitus TaxID=217204 RepID=UPI0007C303AD|nr:hybrid sensor histidine kinase/response regulator [Achromobacter insolitus]OAD16858.1 hybrid sensor histidine kinase/response regulator [Achromobacter insolitus]OAE51632.1 hybrid sensor histidine kinase/response regulator [Achromobacter insolitus]OCZ50293.1 hybrid sensor histidine kinase/response regulator [Achromobacter insolitus]QEK92761.1 hybrid sensor histidine kinase/response regulator [Achromobacter insolitus]CAB3957962.1 Sensor histidine kinase RcsC [Achromobacter insolitus]
MNPEQMRDASLLELFQLETRTQVQVLNNGLLALEHDPTSAPQLEACMRAAHSLKGAARIVDLHPAVRIAHAMEDCLVEAREGRLRLQAADIDALLLGADLLQRVATPGAELGSEIDELVERLSNAPHTPPAAVSVPKPSDFLPPIPAMDEQPAAVLQRRSSDLGLGEGERVLRVTADTLNKLLGLSSETLVESHWIGPFGSSMLRLKRMQAGAVQALDGVRAALAGQVLDAQAQAALDDALRIVEQCQQELSQRTSEVDEFGWRMGHLAQRLYDTALACRMRPFGDGVGGMARMVRDIGRALGKQVRLEIEGESTQVDRDILEKLDAPLMHLLRNAVDHGIEMPQERLAAGKPAEGLIRLSARHAAGMLLIELSDDGAGISLDRLRTEVAQRKLASAETAARLTEAELLEFLFLSGFSTRGEVTEISGRGVGLDVVQTMVRQLRGAVRIQQHTGQGTRFMLEMPLSLSVVRSLLVEVQDEIYAFPLAYVNHALQVRAQDIEQLEGHQHFRFMDRQIGLVSARQILRKSGSAPASETVCVVLIGDHDRLYGIAVDRYVGERTLVVQPLDPRLGKVQDVMAGALMDDGTPLLILDVEDMLVSVQKLVEGGQLTRVDGAGAAEQTRRRKRVLVVDDSLTVRELERKLLVNRGYDVAVAVDGMDGWNMLRGEAFDLVVTDVDMPRMDGIELVSRIKADPKLQGLPVMVVSYKDREEDRRRGLDAGADYYLAKGSFHDDALLEAVEDLIGKAHT